ncbi:MAG: M15 family metallopeptidase [bacterium]|nr:M15 family metallopeptidase [bacterium]
MASRKIEDLHPIVAKKAITMVTELAKQGIDIIITSTLRTMDEQAEIYAIGRTKPGRIITNAKPGQSWHNFGLAFDVVPVVNGKAVWDSYYWEEIGAVGKAQGMMWGGDFKSFKDYPHFEYHPGLTLAMAKWGRKEELLTI